MKRLVTVAFAVALGAAIVPLASASGPVSVFGIIEKVVLEPNGQLPERIQVWGAFAYAHVKGWSRSEGDPSPSMSAVQRGYLYFRVPPAGESVATVRREWADLTAVAGTGQAVGFGGWQHTGRFDRLRPDTTEASETFLAGSIRGSQQIDLRVRPASERPTAPAVYQTNAGIVKLSGGGSHAAVVRQLKAALAK